MKSLIKFNNNYACGGFKAQSAFWANIEEMLSRIFFAGDLLADKSKGFVTRKGQKAVSILFLVFLFWNKLFLIIVLLLLISSSSCLSLIQ